MSSVNLSWDADGTIDFYMIYRSELPMSVDSLPAPLAENVLDKTYTDTTVVDGATYFYRVASVKGGTVKVSSEQFEIKAGGDPFWDKVIFFAPFTSNTDDTSLLGIATTNINACTIDSSDGAVGLGCLSTPEKGYIEAQIDAKFGTSDFTIEFYAKTSKTSPAYFGIVSFEGQKIADNSLFVITIQDVLANSGLVWFSSNATSWDIFVHQSVGALNNNSWNHWALVRNGTSLKVYRNGTVACSATLPSGFSLVQKGNWSSIGVKDCNPDGGAESKFQFVRITKQARYTTNFTPPTAFYSY